MSTHESQASAPAVKPLEEVAGDVMQLLLEFTFRFQKERAGEAAALAMLDQVGMNKATFDARMQIRGGHTHLLCRLVPHDDQPPMTLADWDLMTTLGGQALN